VSSDFTSDTDPLQRLLASAYVVQESGIGADLLASVAELQQQIDLGDLTLDEATQRIVQRALCVADASGTAVALLKADQLVYHAGSGSAASYVGRRVMATLTASAALEAGAEILRVEDADSDARIQAAICRQFGAKSLLILPVHCDRELSGVLQIFFDLPHYFTDPEVRVYRLLAGLVEQALSAPSHSEVEVLLSDPFDAEHSGSPQILESVQFAEPIHIDQPEELDDPAPAAVPVCCEPVPASFVYSAAPSAPHQAEEVPAEWIRPASLAMFGRVWDAGVAAIALIAVVSFLLYQARTSNPIPTASPAADKTVSDHPIAVVPPQTSQPPTASPDPALSGAHLVSAMPKHSPRPAASRVEHLGDDVTVRHFPAKPADMPTGGTNVRRVSDDVTVRYFKAQTPGESQTR
jgi:hypothetical protein